MVVEWYLSRKYPIQEDIHEDNILRLKVFSSNPAMIAFDVFI